MSDTVTDATPAIAGRKQLQAALHQNEVWSPRGLSERLFALFFSGLVYPQIWEDPDIDIEAMALAPEHRVVSIASGGCNILAYLTCRPAQIEAVDLNPTHIALNRLKLAAITHLPAHADIVRFFGKTDQKHNSKAYDRFLAPRLDNETRAYWERRNWRGKRRVELFDENFYRAGLLGWFISAAHLLARFHGVDPKEIMHAKCLREQRRFFDEQLAPLFERPLIRWITAQEASLFGLGIPPKQYDALLSAAEGPTMASVLRRRLEKLTCHFPLRDNYFARQAFSRRYDCVDGAAVPAYLDPMHYEAIRSGTARVTLRHINLSELLARKPAGSVDRYVLLDAQDWMNNAQLNALWAEITRTATSGARVIFRTAGEASILPGRVADTLLSQWDYRLEESERFGRRDRSAIYGGFHLYVKKAA